MAQSQAPHIAILPGPGIGHLIPLTEFAKRLVHHHNITLTFIVPCNGPPTEAEKSVLEALPTAIDHVFLPPVSFDDVPQCFKVLHQIFHTVSRSLPALRDAIKSLVSRTKLVGLVVDLFGTDALDVSKEFNLSNYIFYPSSAMSLSLFLYLPELDQTTSCEYGELPDPITLPGCIPIHGRDLLDLVQDRQFDAYKWVLHHAKRYRSVDGIIVNSFSELEPGALRALQQKEPGKPPVYPVGPLVKMEFSNAMDDQSSKCLKWLDDQRRGSVLFVAFGSGATLSHDQISELALGLELSDQRFLWAVRSPNDKAANTHNDPLEFLPEGFLGRTQGKGLVVPNWAPQAQILTHGSTGGFLTHCGWNSALESVVNGVPLVAWPLYAEQKMNAIMFAEDIKVALRPKAGENGLVGREEIALVIQTLMEGEEGKRLRNRMKDLKDAGAQALSENGDSPKALSDVFTKWKIQISS